MKNLLRPLQQNETIADMARYVVVAGTVKSNAVKEHFHRLHHDEQGAALLEYTVLLGVILAGTIATVVLVGTEVTAIWTKFNTTFLTVPGA